MKGKRSFTRAEADEIRSLLRQKTAADAVRQKSIRGRIRSLGFYISDFGGISSASDFDRLIARGGVLILESDGGSAPDAEAPGVTTPDGGALPRQPRCSAGDDGRDEAYVIDLCDRVLERSALRQHRFDWLRGDPGRSGVGACLPVDAFYPSLSLVVEYCERQHTERVAFFDRRHTVSGVSRGDQRRIYDERRRIEIPRHGLVLVELHFSDFAHSGTKRLLRNRADDIRVIRDRLVHFLS